MIRWATTTLGVLAITVAAGTGCSQAPSAATEEDPILRKTGTTSNWSYKGLMPELESPKLTVSLSGHTVHVTGLLPASFSAQGLPYYARTEPSGGRTLVHLAYPIATVDPNGTLESGLNTRNPEPFSYQVCGGDNFKASNRIGNFGGFPFIEYVCDHEDADGRVRGGIAFHGPITSSEAEGSEYWFLKRGPVSHACNRMLGEHVLELAHVIGFDRNSGVNPPVKVIKEFDTFQGKTLDVDYPSTNWTRPSGAYVFPIWQAVMKRSDGSIGLQFPRWACETSRCASMPANAYDSKTGAKL